MGKAKSFPKIRYEVYMVPTPHNEAKKEDIAKAVIMPGDPLRSKWIAQTFLDEPRLVNNIRGIQGYTGRWKGVPVTVMASGMGISSIGIYVYELFNFYDVQKIIRTGTAGAVQPQVKVGDIIIADKAYTDSTFPGKLGFTADHVLQPDPALCLRMKEIAEELLRKKAKGDAPALHTGAVLTEELYYGQDDIVPEWQKKGVLAFEMEAAVLFAYAEKAGKQAGAVFTASNNILTGEEMDPQLRETALFNMTEVALDAAAGS